MINTFITILALAALLVVLFALRWRDIMKRDDTDFDLKDPVFECSHCGHLISVIVDARYLSDPVKCDHCGNFL